MANNTRRTRSYRGGSRRTSGRGALVDTVRNTITGLTGSGRRGARRGGSGGVVAQASGFIGGLLGSDRRRRR